MLKMLDPWQALPAVLRAGHQSINDSLVEPERLQAINRAVDGLPCSLLPDGRSDFAPDSTQIDCCSTVTDRISFVHIHTYFSTSCAQPQRCLVFMHGIVNGTPVLYSMWGGLPHSNAIRNGGFALLLLCIILG